MSFIDREKNFRRVFDEYYVALCMFAERYVGNPDTASDIVQECFIALWEQRKNFEGIRPVKSFLYTSIRNKALNELARLKTIRKHEMTLMEKAGESFFYDHIIEQELYGMLMDKISELPRQARKVMSLAIQGYRNPEIAVMLEISEGTVQTHKKLAYRKLRVSIGEKSLDAFLSKI